MSKVLTLTEPRYSATVEDMGKVRTDKDGNVFRLVRPLRGRARGGFWAREDNLHAK